MCVVSFVGDHYSDKFKQQPYQQIYTNISEVSKAEFDLLKKEVLEMKELLKKAKIYDEVNNEPNCETDEKMAMLRKFAEAVGVDLDKILKK